MEAGQQEARLTKKGRLVPGQVIQEKLKEKEGHGYEIELKAGQYLHVAVEQKDADVALRLVTPGGEQRPLVDSPTGQKEFENLLEVAEVGGLYQVEVWCFGAEPDGGYEARIVELREADEQDRMRHRAFWAFAEAEDLRRKKTRVSYEAALTRYQESIPLWRALADRQQEARALEEMGRVLSELSQHARALEANRQALTLYVALKNQKKAGVLQSRIGTTLFSQGRFAEALLEYRAARDLFHEIGSPFQQAAALNNMGHVFLATGQTQEALTVHRQALPLAREGKNRSAESLALFGIGDALVTQGKLEMALDSLQEALRLEGAQNDPGHRANVLRRIANVLQRMGRLEEAKQHLEQALEIQRPLGDLHGEGVTLNSLGTLFLFLDQPKAALVPYQRALEIFRQVESPDNEAFALVNLGRYYHAVGEDRQAFRAHEEAAALFRRIEDRSGEAATLFGSARALHNLKDYRGAGERLEQVLEKVELLRGASVSPGLQSSYFATKQHYFDLYVDVLMHLHEQEPQGRWDEQAFSINERRRARGMLDLLGEAGKEIRGGADPALITREAEIQARVSAIETVLLEQRQDGEENDILLLEKEQRALLADLDAVQGEIRNGSPRFRELTSTPLSIQEIQREVLDESSIMLVYSLGEERSFLWKIARSGAIESHVLPARSWIEDNSRRVYSGWSRRGTSRQSDEDRWVNRLSQTLLGPVRGKLGTKRLLVVSDGALQYLPFGALTDPEGGDQSESRPLVWKREVVHLPSASVIATLRRELDDRLPARLQVAVIGDPVFSPEDPRVTGGEVAQKEPVGMASPEIDLERSARDLGVLRFERLPFTGAEAEAIRKLVREDLRFEALGLDANRETVTSGKLKSYRILHFATHGILNEKHPDLSGLVLSLVDKDGNPKKGFLRSYEICGLGLQAELAVLSACQTGLGEDVRGEGLVGLMRSFMYAGVPRVVVSLWNVNDRGSAELMQRFYRGMYVHQLTPAAALRCAQLSMSQEEMWSDPYYWAPFVFQGEWESARQRQKRSDGIIEAEADGGAAPKRSDNDLPPPEGDPVPPGCPAIL